MGEINSTSQQSLNKILNAIGVKSSEENKITKNKSTLGQEDFLKLMTTQLQNQDPFAPMENGDFIAQMAQFSTVTGITEMSNSMKELTSKVSEFRIATAAQFLGHSVLVPGNRARPNDDGEIHGVVDLPYSTTDLAILFHKENGELLYKESLGAQTPGLVGFAWKDLPEDIKNGNAPILVSAYLGDNPQQPAGTAVYAEIIGAAAKENGVELEIEDYGLIDASKAIRFRN